MRKLTDEQRKALIEQAETARDNAPLLDADAARTLHEKWRTDEAGYNEKMAQK